MAYAATIGFFDGVHAGHRFLLEQLRQVAADSGLQSAVLTFDEHPQSVLTGKAIPLLSTWEERTERLKAVGVDEIFSFHFEVIQLMTAEEFMHVLRERCGVEVLLMGYDHQFGSDQLTDFADYQVAAKRVGLRLVPIAQAPQGAVSSSKIRRALQVGDVERAQTMLGYAYTLTGQVVHGNGLGRQLGYPTANINVPAIKMLPANGVYAVKVIEPVHRKGILNIGTNPTIGNTKVTVELHIPGFTGDLYHTTITVQLLHHIREERTFASLEALQQQIAMDIDSIQHPDGNEHDYDLNGQKDTL